MFFILKPIKMSQIIWKDLYKTFKVKNFFQSDRKINEEDLLKNDKNENTKLEKNKNSRPIEKKLPPIKPIEPAYDECCGQGCLRCVFDIYYEKLEKYEQEMEEYKKRMDLEEI